MSIDNIDQNLTTTTSEIFKQIGIDIRNLRQQLDSSLDNQRELISPQTLNNTPEVYIANHDGNKAGDLLEQYIFNNDDVVFAEDWSDNNLISAITISVYTDARVNGERGWWGDSYNDQAQDKIANSRLWTILGKPATAENTRLGEDYVKESLQWLLDDKLLKKIDVFAESQVNNHLDTFAFKINATKPDGSQLTVNL